MFNLLDDFIYDVINTEPNINDAISRLLNIGFTKEELMYEFGVAPILLKRYPEHP